MPSSYEFWLLDDTGKRIVLLQNYSYFSYSRSLLGYGTFLMGIPYEDWKKQVYPTFQVDWRVDVWRAADEKTPMRREAMYLLRMQKIYTRVDGITMIAFTGRDLTDLLSRRFVMQAAGSLYTYKSAPVDDMMKQIVREQMTYGLAADENGTLDPSRAFPPEFTVQEDLGLGPTVALAFADRNVMDVIRELKQASFQLNAISIANNRIFYDIVPRDMDGIPDYILEEASGRPIADEVSGYIESESGGKAFKGVGFQFQTFAILRGQDRTQEIEFSIANNNLKEPYFSDSSLEEVNAVTVKGYGRGDSRVAVRVEDTERVNASRWNRMEGYKDGSQEPDQSRLADIGYPELYAGQHKEEFSAVFLNTPGGPDSPRSLYGVDWDLGDLVRASYAGKQFNLEIVIVYVAIDENGIETITGRNQVSASAG